MLRTVKKVTAFLAEGQEFSFLREYRTLPALSFDWTRRTDDWFPPSWNNPSADLPVDNLRWVGAVTNSFSYTPAVRDGCRLLPFLEIFSAFSYFLTKNFYFFLEAVLTFAYNRQQAHRVSLRGPSAPVPKGVQPSRAVSQVSSLTLSYPGNTLRPGHFYISRLFILFLFLSFLFLTVPSPWTGISG